LPWNPSDSHGEIKITSGAGDLASADATTNTNNANGAAAALSLSAMISQYFMLLHRLRQNRFMNNEEKA
jgi:hypothetical protein